MLEKMLDKLMNEPCEESDAGSRLTGICRNNGRIDKEKLRIMEFVGTSAVLNGGESRVRRQLFAAEMKFLLACSGNVAILKVFCGFPLLHVKARQDSEIKGKERNQKTRQKKVTTHIQGHLGEKDERKRVQSNQNID